jgi:hypothetical protein
MLSASPTDVSLAATVHLTRTTSLVASPSSISIRSVSRQRFRPHIESSVEARRIVDGYGHLLGIAHLALAPLLDALLTVPLESRDGFIAGLVGIQRDSWFRRRSRGLGVAAGCTIILRRRGSGLRPWIA